CCLYFCVLTIRPRTSTTLFPYTTLFRSLWKNPARMGSDAAPRNVEQQLDGGMGVAQARYATVSCPLFPKRRRRRALPSTKTLDRAMAPAANMGDSSRPKAG